MRSSSSSRSCFSSSPPHTSPHASGWSKNMTLDYVIGLLVTVGLLVYLTYALLRPEKF
jgi:K+-transporting ATPase KdpF subunit